MAVRAEALRDVVEWHSILHRSFRVDIATVEAYRGASETPREFAGPRAECGTVVIRTTQR